MNAGSKLHDSNRTAAIIIGTIIDLAISFSQVIVMCGNENILILFIGSFQDTEYVGGLDDFCFSIQ